MTASGKSQKETTGVKLEVMSAKSKTRMGFGIYVLRELAEVTAEMRWYNLDVLGESESGWIGAGRLKTMSGETVLYSRRDDELHCEGVAIVQPFRCGSTETSKCAKISCSRGAQQI